MLVRFLDWIFDVYCDGMTSDGIRRDATTEALQEKIGTLSLEAQSKLEEDVAKKEVKAARKADAELKKKLVRLHFLNPLTITKSISHLYTRRNRK